MDRIDDARLLLQSTGAGLSNVELLYRQSLLAKHVSPELKIAIKHILENLRSALDFIAKEISDRYCTKPASRKHISVYFPVIATGRPGDFQNKMKGQFPDLESSFPTLYAKLEGCQLSASPENAWLVQLNDLCNENKHEQLSPQERVEEVEGQLTDTSGGTVGWKKVRFEPGSIVFKPGGQISFGKGGRIGIGKSSSSVMGRPVDQQSQLPATQPGDSFKRVVWVDFLFSATRQPVLPFLKNAYFQVDRVVTEMSGLIALGPR